MENKENLNAQFPHGIVRDRQPLQTLYHDNVQGGSTAPQKTETADTKAQLRLADPWIQNYLKCFSKDYLDDGLSDMLNKEQPLGRVPAIPRRQRAKLVNWMIEIKGPEVNAAGLIQTALWYLDSYATNEAIHPDMSKLLAVASMWIAQKVHLRGSSKFHFHPRLVKTFPQSTVATAEKLILRKLGFRVQTIVPQDYIPYLVWYSEVQGPWEIERAATFICMAGIMTLRRLSTAHPSVIACAAVIYALKKLRGMEGVQRILESPFYHTAERREGDILAMCVLLKKAGHTIGETAYPYKAPIINYGKWPQFLDP